MFKFDFQVEEEDDNSDLNLPGPSQPAPIRTGQPLTGTNSRPCYHPTLDELLSNLPETISYSPISVPGLDEPLLRRDLFDARFQIISDDVQDEQTNERPGEYVDNSSKREDQGEEYVDSGTDLIPGLYEGGLKTWEGGVDLVEVLNGVKIGEGGDKGKEKQVGSWVRGARVLEVGCGTSLPTSFLLRSLLSQDRPKASNPSTKTIFHLQDYNRPVLALVTLPNLLLASLPFFPPETLHQPDDSVDVEETVPDLSVPGTLNITPQVKDAFKSLLDHQEIELKFTYGHWSGLADELKDVNGDEKYDLVLTAETIYSEDSVEDLMAVLKNASRVGERRVKKVEVGIADELEDLQVKDKRDETSLADNSDTVVLVAAKVLYFGVGGGIQAFLKRVENWNGWWEDVRVWSKGVARKVVRIGWTE